jgi:thiol-disulfide isomerase/thioredoxin
MMKPGGIFKNQSRIFDILLVIVIIGLASLLYFRFEDIFRVFRDNEGESDTSSYVSVEDGSELGESLPTATPEPPAKLAENFELQNLDGETIALTDFAGKSVMINFWATWCPPCLNELPMIQDYADRHADDFVVLAVNAGEDHAKVAEFVSEFGYDLVFLLDPENFVGNIYRVMGLPTSIFIDEGGFWRVTHIGELDEPLLKDYLEKIGVTE